MTDPFDTAKSSFFHASDLDGCLVAVMGNGTVKEMKGDAGPYEIAEATIVVLAGKPSEGVTEEYGPKLPITMEEFGLMGPWLVEKVKLSTKKGRAQLGRIKGFKNSRKTTSYRLDEPTEADVTVARKHIDVVQAAVDKAVAESSPFDAEPTH